jgi:uncharacterized protein YecE (DUF72 family)
VRLRVGCSGWSYPEWVGPFYPRGTAQVKFLGLYAKVFDSVEIDSTFYGVPGKEAVKRWRSEVPEGFAFCPKAPQEVAGGRRSGNNSEEMGESEDADEVLDEFLGVVDPLGERLGPLVFQYPPSYARGDHALQVETLLDRLGKRRSAFEFRHKSWFEEPTYKVLEDHNAALVWSETTYLEVPPQFTADFLVLRFIGDRSFDPRGSVDHPKDQALGKWADRIETRAAHLDETFVFFNNHFEGFGPGSANRFLARMGKREVDWKRALDIGGRAQRKLAEF